MEILSAMLSCLSSIGPHVGLCVSSPMSSISLYDLTSMSGRASQSRANACMFFLAWKRFCCPRIRFTGKCAATSVLNVIDCNLALPTTLSCHGTSHTGRRNFVHERPRASRRTDARTPRPHACVYIFLPLRPPLLSLRLHDVS